MNKMLLDYYDYIDHLPCEMGEYQCAMTLMREIYTGNPSRSSMSRIDAYREDRQADFMERPAEMIYCQTCGVHYYSIEPMEVSPICSKCHQEKTSIQDIYVWEIPVYVDVDNFSW